MRLLPVLLLPGCWILTDDDLADHDRGLRDPTSPTTPPPVSGPVTDGDTGDGTGPVAPTPVACPLASFDEAPFVLAAGALATTLAAGDLDGDGVVDLVAADLSDGTVSYAFGAKDGTYEVQAPFALPATAPSVPRPIQVVIGEFDGDGRPGDVAIVDEAGAELVVLHAVDGALELATTLVGSGGASAVASAPLDEDATPDFAVVTRYGMLDRHLRQEDGFASAEPIPVGGRPTLVEAADLDGDGVFDLVVADNDAVRLGLWQGVGDGAFTELGEVATFGEVTALATAHLDGDAWRDLLVTDAAGQVGAWLATGPATFGAGVVSAAGAGPVDLAPGDFLGDGCTSLVVADRDDGGVAFLRGLGDGTFAAPILYETVGEPSAVVVAQLDGSDTPLDFAVVSSDGGVSTIQLFLGRAP